MRLSESSRTIERHGEIVETSFSINNSRKAFSVLSSLLYRDKIRAIIRELSCNAYDAHVAVGKVDQPFTVHLPNILEPYFSVRDEGSGLSPTDIETVYTTYFASTKTNSNDFIGALGLGSKSPFSYVDSFTVASRYDGIQYNYAAFISEDGEPKIARLSQHETNEPNGLEVSLPIKHSRDFNDFANKASIILSRFNPRPIVVGHHDFKFENDEVLLAGDGWRLTKFSNASQSNAIALMGCVAYPIVPSAINTLSEKAISVLTTPLEIDFPIGTLDVTAGREDLSYDKTTLAALEQCVAKIVADAPLRFQQEFDRCETEYEARLLYGKLLGYGSLSYRLLPSSEYEFFFKGKSIKSNNLEIDITGMDDFYAEFYCDPYAKHKHQVFKDRTGTLQIQAHQKLVIIDNDLNKSNRNRILFDRKKNPNRILLALYGKDEHRQDVIHQLEGVPVEFVSMLPKPPSAPRSPKSETNAAILDLHMSRHRSAFAKYLWKNTVIDPKMGGVYVHKSGCSVIANDDTDHNFLNVLREAMGLGLIYDQMKLYGLSCAVIKKCKKEGEWQHFYDYVRERLIIHINDPQVLLRESINILERKFDYLRNAKEHIRIFAYKFPTEHPINMFFEQWDEASKFKQHGADQRISSICQMLNIEHKGDRSLVNAWESLLKTYQMLHIFRFFDGSIIDYDHLVKYVEWVDQNIVENHS